MHVGAVLALHEAGIQADVVAGTSAGAFVGCFYAAGCSPEEMRERALRLRWAELRRHLFSMRALMSNDRMAAWLRHNLPILEFDRMPKPFAAVATDLLDGSMVILTAEKYHDRIRAGVGGGESWTETDDPPGSSGELNEPLVRRVDWITAPVPVAVAASSAIPVIFEPVRVANRLLVDGGVACMVPASVARWLGADQVIGVDILPPRQVATAPRTIVEYAIQSHRIGAQWALRNRSIHADYVLRLRAVNGRWNDMRRMKELISIGYEETAAAIPDIREKLGLREKAPVGTAPALAAASG